MKIATLSSSDAWKSIFCMCVVNCETINTNKNIFYITSFSTNLAIRLLL